MCVKTTLRKTEMNTHTHASTHARTHAHTLVSPRTPAQVLSVSVCLSLSLSHTHTRRHTHTHAQTGSQSQAKGPKTCMYFKVHMRLGLADIHCEKFEPLYLDSVARATRVSLSIPDSDFVCAHKDMAAGTHTCKCERLSLREQRKRNWTES